MYCLTAQAFADVNERKGVWQEQDQSEVCIVTDFMCNNWILSMMHMLRWVNRTCIHNIIHANMNDREADAAYITAAYVTALLSTRIFVSIFLNECPLHKFLNLFTGGKGPISITLSLWHGSSNKLKKGKHILPGRCMKHSKVNTVLRLDSLIRIQKLIDCDKT